MSDLIPGKSFNLSLPYQHIAVQLPPLTDLVALLGIDLVLCAAGLRLVSGRGLNTRRAGVVLACFVFFWLPLGGAGLPLLAYVRGISSDLSVTLVALACLVLGQRLFGLPAMARRDKIALSVVTVVAASLLYPTALGWGNWDAYRLGWGSYSLLGVLLAVMMFLLFNGLWLVPALAGLALMAWVGGLMESTNLWDYLIDPWLAVGATIQCITAGVRALTARNRRSLSVDRPLQS